MPSRQVSARMTVTRLSIASAPTPAGLCAVWSVSVCPLNEMQATALLTAAEHVQAAKFRSARDRARFVTTRGATRMIVATHLGVRAADVAFSHNRYGALGVAWPRAPVQISVAHSGALGLIAIADGRRIGVDVELIRGNLPSRQIASRWFHPFEQDRLSRYPPSQYDAYFLRHWVAKEAYTKGLGLGLHKRLSEFAVDVPPSSPARVVCDEAGGADAWELHLFDAAPGYIGAVAHESAQPATGERGMSRAASKGRR